MVNERAAAHPVQAAQKPSRQRPALLCRPWTALALVCAVLAFGLYQSGIWSARRDPLLDGALLYLARIVQLVAYFGVAYAFRNHLPSARGMLGAALGSFALYGLLQLAVPAAQGAMDPVGSVASIVAGVASGVANAAAILLALHVLSTFEPRVSAPAIAVGALITEGIFGWTSSVDAATMVWVQALLRLAGLGALAAAVACKGRACAAAAAGVGENPATLHEHPLQYGLARDDSPAAGRPMAFLVGGPDWAFQVIVALLLPFAFGFMSQLVSTDGLSAGLHDPVSEAVAIALLAVLAACMLRWGERLGFTAFFVVVVLLYGTGFLVLPTLWAAGSPFMGVFLKGGITLYHAMLWILLARKAYGDPRRTYLYFGAFLGLSNVTYGRLAEPVVMGSVPVTEGLLCQVSMVFLWLFVLGCLLLFVLQRTAYAGAGPSQEPAWPANDAASPEPPAPAKDPFMAGLDRLCDECRLTPRERDVLVEVLHGYSMANAARNLGISPETVRTHMRNIYQKTGRTNKQALIQSIERLAR